MRRVLGRILREGTNAVLGCSRANVEIPVSVKWQEKNKVS